MNIYKGDYYQLSSNGYSKHANVEVIAVDQAKSNFHSNAMTQFSNTNSQRKNSQHKNQTIKEEDVEYEPPSSKNSVKSYSSRKQPYQLFMSPREMLEKEEVHSIHIDDLSNRTKENLTQSYISNHKTVQTVQRNGILKRSLHQIPKGNLKSQEDSLDDKHLYLELQKERLLRENLEKSYKELLKQLNRERECFNKSLSEEINKKIIKVDQIEEKSYQVSQNHPTEENKPNLAEEISNQEPQASEEQNQINYFEEQLSNQQKILNEIQNMSQKISKVQENIMQRDEKLNKERLEREINEKEKEIVKMANENERLRRMQELSNQPSKEENQIHISYNTMKNIFIVFMVLLVIFSFAKK